MSHYIRPRLLFFRRRPPPAASRPAASTGDAMRLLFHLQRVYACAQGAASEDTRTTRCALVVLMAEQLARCLAAGVLAAAPPEAPSRRP